MKFLTLAALLVASTEAANLNALRHHHHHFDHQYVSTLPDVRADTVSDKDIAAHEKARAEAAKVKKNPQASLLESIKTDLEQINKDLSFGVSFSQAKRNDHARELSTKVSNAIVGYAKKLIKKVETKPDEALTEQNAHNIAAMIFYDVQLQDAQKSLGVAADEERQLYVNRLKSLQKLYLFEQKGGENYLGWTQYWFNTNKKNQEIGMNISFA